MYFFQIKINKLINDFSCRVYFKWSIVGYIKYRKIKGVIGSNEVFTSYNEKFPNHFGDYKMVDLHYIHINCYSYRLIVCFNII